MSNRCSKCSFWKSPQVDDLPASVQSRTGSEANDPGECRKNPPAVVPAGEWSSVSKWPETKSDDWCGEFRALLKAAEYEARESK